MAGHRKALGRNIHIVGPDLSSISVREELTRILQSQTFSNAPSLSRFLSYVVEHALEGNGEQLKEYSLGVEVFGRGESFDPRTDTIVRVEARRLRAKLAEYYESEGRTDPVVIEVPKGRYVPAFRSPGPAMSLKNSSPRRLWGKKAWAGAGVAILLTISLIWWGRRDMNSPGRVQSIAVLPLENLSGDDSQDYFADGLTETLITELGKIRKLRVVSRSAVTKYKGSGKLFSEIAAELKVDALVEGSVMRMGDRVRIIGRVIHAKTGRRLWSQSYERDVRDILALQKEVARVIAIELRAELTPQERESLSRARAVHSESYDAYLRGLFHSRRENPVENKAAIEMFERAVALDPAFAAAHAELARSYIYRFFMFTPGERQWEEKAFVAVRRALALEPDLAAAHRTLGRLLWTPSQGFAHERAIQEYRRALSLNPNLEEAHHELGLIYSHIGLLDEALQELEHEMEINPISAARPRIGQVLIYQGKYEAALSHLEAVSADVNPGIVGFHTAWALLELGRTEEALAQMEEIHQQHPVDTGGLLAGLEAVALAASGDESFAEAKSTAAAARGKGYGHFHHTAYAIASAYALMRKPGLAVWWLHRAAEEGFPCYPMFAKDPMLDPVRQDPAFIAFLSKQKHLLERWRASLVPMR